MKIADLHPAVREALALHEVFLRLDFTPSEIYVHAPNPVLMVEVRRSGRTFNCSVDHIPWRVSAGEFASVWKASVACWNTTTDAVRTEIYESSRAFAQKVPLVTALTLKGFSLRKADA